MSTVIQTTAPLPTEWANKMAQYAKDSVANERSPGALFSTKAGQLSFGGIAVPNNKMQVVIVASAFENVYYPNAYDAGNPESPVCYALSVDGTNMVPHPNAEGMQSPACRGCPWNAWDTGKNGKGKACKEQRRLALLSASSLTSPEAVMAGVIGYLRIPVTSVKGYSEHVKHCGMRGMPPFAIVSEVALQPDPKTMWKTTFSIVDTINDAAILGALEARHDVERTAMLFPYPRNAPGPAAGAAGAAPASAKF